MSESKPFSVREAAAYLGISVGTLRVWCQKHRLAYYKLNGSRVRFYQSDLDAFLAKGRVEAVEAVPEVADADIPQTPEVAELEAATHVPDTVAATDDPDETEYQFTSNIREVGSRSGVIEEVSDRD